MRNNINNRAIRKIKMINCLQSLILKTDLRTINICFSRQLLQIKRMCKMQQVPQRNLKEI